jgi:hypothetical protein
LALLIRGDYVVGDATLNRFFSFHVIAVPLVLLGLVVAHIIALHEVGSNNPDGVEIKEKKDANGIPLDGIPFHPYYSVHDIMGMIGALALVANVASVLLLMRYAEGDANVRSVWLCSRNDAIGNVAVMIAALAVWGTTTAWPDLIVAAIMASLFFWSAVQIIRQSRADTASGSNYHCGAISHLFFVPFRSTGIHAVALWQLHIRWQGSINRSIKRPRPKILLRRVI